MDYLMGIDIGTTGCKATLFDLQLNPCGTGYRSYEIISPKAGWAEEDPDEWWLGMAQAVRDSLDRYSPDRDRILAAAVSCTNGLVPMDKEGNCLSNAIMQIDGRTDAEADFIASAAGKDEIFAVTGNRVAPGTFSAPIIVWFKRHRPEIYQSTWKFLAPGGFIVQRLTGRFTMDYTRASTTLLFDIRKKEWSERLCGQIGVDIEKLPDPVASETVVGTVTKEAALFTGLPEGIPVAAGAMDTVAAAIGIGCVEADSPLLIVGTVARLCIPMKDAAFDRTFLNAAFTSETPYIAMAPTNGGGISLKWFLNAFCESEGRAADRLQINPYGLLDAEALRAPPGSEGIIYLPYIAGERSPIWDPHARGVFFGISCSHKKCHFIRAIMEGIAYATRQNMEIYERVMRNSCDNIVACGGGIRSEAWRMIFADILGKTIAMPRSAESETKGGAYIAGMAAGVYSSYREAKKLASPVASVSPAQASRQKYDALFEVYKSLYQSLKEDYRKLNGALNAR